jgi:predicted AAA+ superfamily ATPase
MYTIRMYRELQPQITSLLSGSNAPIILLLGLRQTGKSTLAKAALSALPYIQYSFDLPSDQKEFINQNRHSLHEFAARNSSNIILIDEVQKCPEATNIIKHLFDQYRLKFILTGSSELLLRRHYGDSLAGRTRTFTHPFRNFKIFLQSNTPRISQILLTRSCQKIYWKFLISRKTPNYFLSRHYWPNKSGNS